MDSAITIEEQGKVLCRLSGEKHHKQTLGFLGNSAYYVYETSLVGNLCDELNQLHSMIPALAVVDFQMKVKGIILTGELFGLMGRQFGRAILSKKMVRQVAKKFTPLNYRQNIFAAEQKIGADLQAHKSSYYILVDDQQHYRGLFSSQDMLVYLSDISRKDISLAQNLQRRISKEETSIHEVTFDLVASSRSAKGVGGDYYSLLKTRGDNWIISVCDVSGKGVSASLLTTTIWGMMSIYPFNKGLAPFLYKVNNYIYNTFESEKFITGIFLEFNSSSGEITLCDMGHSYMYIYRNKKFTPIKLKGNMPIGVAPSGKLMVNRLHLQSGDYLFIPTDGLLEQENHIRELYPPENIGKIIAENEDRPIEDINRKIAANFQQFKGEEHLHDDVTYLLLKYYDVQAKDEYSQSK